MRSAVCLQEHSNGLQRAPRDACSANGSGSAGRDTPEWEVESGGALGAQESLCGGSEQRVCGEGRAGRSSAAAPQEASEQAQGAAEEQQSRDRANDLDFELSSDSESEAGTDSGRAPPADRRSCRGAKELPQKGGEGPEQEQGQGLGNHTGEPQALPPPSGQAGAEPEAQEESEQESLGELGNGCADRKEAETESQNSEQSGITMGESLDQSVEEDDEEDDTDDDDHLIHLEEILARVHSDYYSKYDRYLRRESPEAPDIRKIVPELKSKVLADVTILFSGLYPTNFPMEKTREHYHATALGAKIVKNLVLSANAPDKATHLIAARSGECGHGCCLGTAAAWALPPAAAPSHPTAA